MECDDYASNGTTALSMTLGWFSLALGAAELLAPGRIARLAGIAPNDRATNILRAYGAREIASGIGILAQPDKSRWLWSRVGGDALDLATLAGAARRKETQRTRLMFAAAAVLGIALLDVLAARSTQAAGDEVDEFGFSLEDEQAVTVRAPLETVEAAWVQWCGSGRTRLRNNYAVRFEPAPGARGTEVHLSGGGSKGTIREELRHFKQLLETGEVPISEGAGFWRPAQPPANPDALKKRAEVL